MFHWNELMLDGLDWTVADMYVCGYVINMLSISNLVYDLYRPSEHTNTDTTVIAITFLELLNSCAWKKKQIWKNIINTVQYISLNTDKIIINLKNNFLNETFNNSIAFWIWLRLWIALYENICHKSIIWRWNEIRWSSRLIILLHFWIWKMCKIQYMYIFFVYNRCIHLIVWI